MTDQWDDPQSWKDRCNGAELQLPRSREALTKYRARHTERCASLVQRWSERSQHMENDDRPCDCGLDAALSGDLGGTPETDAETFERSKREPMPRHDWH